MTALRSYLPAPLTLVGAAPGFGVLALQPLFIAGMTRPIEDGDGGVSIAVVTDHDQGVMFVIDPWISMAEGDTVDVFLDRTVVYHHAVAANDVNQRLFFFVEASRFVPGWIEECYFLLHRAGEAAPDDPSVPLRLRVKLDRPAGIDKEPHKPGHSELKIVQLPQEVIEQGIDAEWAAKGVPMTIQRYPNIALRDTVQVKWGSVFLAPLVLTQAHVDGTEPIVVRAEQADILAGGDSSALLIAYEVHDEVWNYSEKWSLTTTVDVEAGASRLEAPIIKESVNGVIDLIQLNQQPVTVQIHVRTEDFAIGDTVTMTWTGTPLIGKPLVHTQSTVIANVPSILELRVPYEEVRALAKGSVDVFYVLTKRDGQPPLASKHAFANVIGDVYAYPAPVVREAVGDFLEPDVNHATVDIRYPGMADGDTVELIWEGTLASGTPYVHTEQFDVSRNDAEAKLITLYVMGEHIGLLANGRLDLWYRVTNDNAAYGVSESEHLLLKVQAIPATLPAPEVPEAIEGVLDPSRVFEKVTVRVGYTGTVKDDILTYYWTAVSAEISTSDWLPITTVSAGKPVNFRVDASFVTPSIGQYVKIRYTLKHAATGLLSYSATYELLIGQLVGELPPPEVLQANAGNLDPMDALAGVDVAVEYANMDPELDTIALKWRGTPGAGTSEDLELPADASGRVQFHLPASVVGPNIGRPVTVTYDVKRYNFWTSSKMLTLNVLRFQSPETQLPRPEVPQAVNQVLDLMAFAGNPDVLVKVWPYIALEQRLWLRLEGKALDGSDYRIVMLDGALITALQVSAGLQETLPRAELLKLDHASPASVVCKVAFDGDVQEHTAIEFPRLNLTIRTRYDYLTPVITGVADQWRPLDNGDVTYNTQVTVTGTATRGQKVEILDGANSYGSADVASGGTGSEGVWSKVLNNLTVKAYHITARALYDANPVASQPWAFTVAVANVPVISNVTDSRGTVANGATTYDRSVTVRGTASPGQKVQLLDGTQALGEPLADGQGDWSHVVTGLTVKAYNLTAKALYGDGPVSAPPRTFVVAEHIAPTLTSVRDSNGEVPQGGRTTRTTVTLQGGVTPDHEVQIHDNNVPKHTVRAVGNVWNTTLNVALGAHSITAKAVSTGQVSNARSFTVVSPLSFNTSPVTLSGKIYLLPAYPNLLPAFGPGTSVRHQASNGQPPYTYTSSNQAVAVVDSTGLVTVRGRGTASITAKDATNQSLSYSVSVSGVIHVFGVGAGTWAQMSSAASNLGAHIPNADEMHEIQRSYGGRWPMGSNFYWSSTPTSYFLKPAKVTVHLVTGARSAAIVNSFFNNHALGVGIR
ncbi:Ig-like domain-containing protein [Pseudomonas sp. COR58]|uniref:Ig-like domain-containing protein n=1 Tax=Pseudomonas ekonensis TaxID=2842353 RepID=A0ABS6PI77_9PSED|nr:Ig-like domain-containing protein [Pseudomonas ekonensis]MBV4459722.1 Ig-like domain-containing protein [Pseudomonas ekonensis]